MNKDVIKEYKKEFDAWLDGAILQYYDSVNNEWVTEPDFIWPRGGRKVNAYQFRIKPDTPPPKTRMIGDIECPIPLTSLKGLDKIFMVDFSTVGGVFEWGESTFNYEQVLLPFGLGFAFDNKEDAKTTADAILKLTQL